MPCLPQTIHCITLILIYNHTNITHIGEGNPVKGHFFLPVLDEETPEFLVKRSRVGEETGGQQDVPYEAVDLSFKAFARLRPANPFTGQTPDEGRSVTHLTTASVCVVQECLFKGKLLFNKH